MFIKFVIFANLINNFIVYFNTDFYFIVTIFRTKDTIVCLLNIQTHVVLPTVKRVTVKEGRRQKMIFVALTTLPVLLLLGLTIGALISNVITHGSGRHLRSRIMLGAQEIA
ncbi:hypothetical protein NP493_915g00040 [Ridgeia piscesae]|uniref:Uncharacterized protein n=1 Tax=Ridgeia piscesae TaxID=27915 RepID=A0AAD9NLH1_RIDPI|nr:hypothetical protein NP493_915g00040 [Ridgeia piscesae]